MSTVHWIPYVVWIGYALYRLIKMKNVNNALFVFTLITTITNSICVILDFWACYNWYYLKNQYIKRSLFVLRYLKKYDMISDDVGTIEWINKSENKKC